MGAEKDIIICPKFPANHQTEICVLSFFCITRSSRKTQSWCWLATTWETYLSRKGWWACSVNLQQACEGKLLLNLPCPCTSKHRSLRHREPLLDRESWLWPNASSIITGDYLNTTIKLHCSIRLRMFTQENFLNWKLSWPFSRNLIAYFARKHLWSIHKAGVENITGTTYNWKTYRMAWHSSRKPKKIKRFGIHTTTL